MKRRRFLAELTRGGDVIASTEAFAWNSAVRASEGLAREYARENGVILEGHTPVVYGGKPAAPGAWYKRNWSSVDIGCSTRVTEVTA